MEDFPVSMKLRIDWSETDVFGHINNLAIMKYAQAGRVKLHSRLVQNRHEITGK